MIISQWYKPIIRASRDLYSLMNVPREQANKTIKCELCSKNSSYIIRRLKEACFMIILTTIRS